MTNAKYRSILICILALALIRGVLYASLVPPWQAPDEPAQFERARAALTAEEWQSTAANGPAWYDELRDSLFTFEFSSYLSPPDSDAPGGPLNHYVGLYQEIYDGLYGNRLSYAVIGLPLFLAREQDITLQLYLVRLNTILMGVAIIFLAYLMSYTIFPNKPFIFLGVPILLLFTPQHTHLLSTVNNGNLAELLALLALYFLTRGVMQGFSAVNIAATIGFSLAAMWTKATAYFLLFSLGSIGMMHLWAYRRYWRWLVPGGLILAVLIYSFAPDRLRLLLSEAWLWLSYGQLQLDPSVIPAIFRSFWAQPGWANMRLNPIWYQILLMACGLALGGLAILLAARWRLLFANRLRPRVRILIALGVSAAVAAAIPVGWHILTGTLAYRHGRSIYPVIVPLYIFLLLGWSQLIPVAWRKTGLLALTVAFFLFDSLVLFSYILPFFYSRY